MTPLEVFAGVGALAVLVTILVRPPLGLLALVVFTPLIDSVPRLPLAGLNVETGLLFLLLAMTLMRFGLRLPPLRYSGPVIAYVLVLLVAWLVGASNFRGIDGKGIWELFKIVKSMSFTTLFFLFSYWWISDDRGRRGVLEALLWSGTLAAVSGVVDYVAPFTSSGMGGRATGILGDPNSLGGYLAVTTLAAPMLLRDGTLGRLRRVLYAALYGLGLLVAVLAQSRAGWLGLLAGHAVLLLLLSPRLLFALTVSAVLLVPPAYPFFPRLVRERIEETFTPRNTVYVGAEEFGSGADRIVYYRIGATMLAESPIWGHGLEAFTMMTPKYGARYGLLSNKAAHSVLIKLAAESGLFGLSMLAWLGFTLAVLGIRLARGAGQSAAIGIAVLAATASISASNLFQVGFVADHLMAGSLWILFGSSARAWVEAHRLSQRTRAPSGWRLRLLEASAAHAPELATRNAPTSS